MCWQGPGLIDIKKTYNLSPKHVWNNVEVSNEGVSIQKNIYPYSYVCFDGKDSLKSLLKKCKQKVAFKKGLDVKIVNNKNPIIINDWISKVFEMKDKLFLLINLNIK